MRMNEALRLVRVFHNLNKTELAERVGLSKSYITELEKSKKVTIDVLEKYSQAFNIPISSLMIFAEHKGEPGKGQKLEALVADKALQMLDWIDTITADRVENEAPKDQQA